MSVWRTTFDIDYFNIVSASSGSENIPPSISITNPPPNSYYELWETVPVRAEVSDPDGSISEVRFYENGNFRSVAGSAPYGCDIAAQPIGTVTITAIAIDNEGAATESEPVDIRVVEYGDPGYIEWSKNGDVIYYNQGPVGIGTYFPGDYELNVIGRIRADEIVVNTEHADFVFGENYCLPPLQQVEEYIKVHQHLPDIVSADEVKENGVGLGELQARLLQKIEELTLYIIEQQKRIELLEQKISETGDE